MTDNTDKATETTLRVSRAVSELANNLVTRGLDQRLVAAGVFNAALDALLVTSSPTETADKLSDMAAQIRADVSGGRAN